MTTTTTIQLFHRMPGTSRWTRNVAALVSDMTQAVSHAQDVKRDFGLEVKVVQTTTTVNEVIV